LHFGGELSDTHWVQGLGVRPGVRGNLVTARIRGLDCCCAVVDAAIQSAGEEKGCLGPSSVQSLDQFLGVLAWAVIKGEGKDAGFAAFGVDNTRCWDEWQEGEKRNAYWWFEMSTQSAVSSLEWAVWISWKLDALLYGLLLTSKLSTLPMHDTDYQGHKRMFSID
jgi:hypothetical protein